MGMFFNFSKDDSEGPYKSCKEMAVDNTDRLIGLLAKRGYGQRDRLFRKLIEEAGEYAEALEFDRGSTRKMKKFKGRCPVEMLREEVSDIIMVGFALARAEGLNITDVLDLIISKLTKREEEHQKCKNIPHPEEQQMINDYVDEQNGEE